MTATKAQLEADLATRQAGVDYWRDIFNKARALRDQNIERGEHYHHRHHAGSQDRACRAERCRRYLVAVGDMVDDSATRDAALLTAAETNKPGALTAATARAVMAECIAAISAAVDAEGGTVAPVAPLAGYADEAALEAAIAAA